MQNDFSRRQMLESASAGFGMLGLASALQTAGASNLLGATAASTRIEGITNGIAPKAKRVIFLFMNGGPSHVDTFDNKPALIKHNGEKPEKTHLNRGGNWMGSPFKFSKHGESGVEMSELLPNLAKCADDMCVLRSMHTDVPNHEPGLLIMHSGHQQPTRPSLGSWVTYGLGSENQNLPSFVSLCPGNPVVGPFLWSNGFLPGEFQGVKVNTKQLKVEQLIRNLKHPNMTRKQQRMQLDLLKKLNEKHLQLRQQDSQLESQIRAMELAFQMQKEAHVAFDVSREPEKVREMYGKSTFGQSCLLARRLAEHGVRFTQVYYVDSGKQPWDTHSDNNARQKTLCADSDRASAALITDLKRRGMLEETLVIWGGEFGRTPYAQKNKKPGRDHHNTGFSMFMAGGGIKGGTMYGNTDEFGMHAVENRVHVHDLHATILHLLGVDHTKLTYRYSGRDFRLTDVHGNVVKDIIS
jgi:hypothetical protein